MVWYLYNIQPTNYLLWYRISTTWAISFTVGEYSAHVMQVLYVHVGSLSHSLTILIHQVPIIAGLAEAVWNEKFTQHIHTWQAGGFEPQTIWSWVQGLIN